MNKLRNFNAVKANMLQMLRYAKTEFDEYKRTGHRIKLQQAGEKLFNAFARYLEFRYKEVTGTHADIWRLAGNDQRNYAILSQLDILHEYFHHGDNLDVGFENIEMIFKNSLGKVGERIKNLR